MKKILTLFVISVLAVSLFAVPARRRPFVVKQFDGTMLTVVQKGDEALHFYSTLDGKYLVKGEDGDFYYAAYSNENGFVSTGYIAHDADNRNSAEDELLSSLNYDGFANEISNTHALRSAKFRRSSVSRAADSYNEVPTTGKVRIPVLLVQYSDVKFTFNKEDINKLLNEVNYKYTFLEGTDYSVTSYGSARDYFIAQSGGMFQPEFVVSDILTLPETMAYYGENDADDLDKRPQEMIRDGLALADKSMDLSQFDNNGDGNVEFVYCIYAGYGEASQADENTVWPHQWNLSSGGTKVKVDGVYCDTYACSSELNMNESYENIYGKYLAGIGTICHEFSHCLGLHDVYDVEGTSGNWCMDEWDLMDQGNYAGDGYIPVGYNSYQKDFCGWKELVVLDTKGNYSMLPQSQGGVGYKIVNDANPNEYFILENRKREGWDRMLAADGMMIIHVDYDAEAWEKNEINITPRHPRFQIVPADNDLAPYGNTEEEYYAFLESLEKDLWPGAARNTQFTDSSLPAAKVYTGGYLGKPVTNIKYENYVASFDFEGAGLAVPSAKPATDITEKSFVANWDVVDGATGYVVELYKKVEAAEGEGALEKLLEEDFMQCGGVNIKIEEGKIDEYTTVPGWNGTNIYCDNGRLRIGAKSSEGELLTPLMNAQGKLSVDFKLSKFNTKDGDFNLEVEVVNGASSVVNNFSAEGKMNVTCYVDGEFYIRFATTAAGVKRVNLDDVAVTVALSHKNELLKSVTTEGESLLFDELPLGVYSYRVKAVSDDEESGFSGYVEVDLSKSTVIETPVVVAGNIDVYTIDGVMMYSGKENMLPELPRGLYIIRCGDVVKKVFVK